MSREWVNEYRGVDHNCILVRVFVGKDKSEMNTDDEGKEMPDSVLTLSRTKCPKCGSTEFEMRNYSAMWHEGDIHCKSCGEFIRTFDAG